MQLRNKKGEKTHSTYDNKDEKKEETVNARDSETVNEHVSYFSITRCGKNICQSTHKRACIASDSIREVSMNLETRYQDFSLLVKQYAHELQILKNRYKRLGPNDMNFDCANINYKI